jgi:hypothetical protein
LFIRLLPTALLFLQCRAPLIGLTVRFTGNSLRIAALLFQLRALTGKVLLRIPVLLVLLFASLGLGRSAIGVLLHQIAGCRFVFAALLLLRGALSRKLLASGIDLRFAIPVAACSFVPAGRGCIRDLLFGPAVSNDGGPLRAGIGGRFALRAEFFQLLPAGIQLFAGFSEALLLSARGSVICGVIILRAWLRNFRLRTAGISARCAKAGTIS